MEDGRHQQAEPIQKPAADRLRDELTEAFPEPERHQKFERSVSEEHRWHARYVFLRLFFEQQPSEWLEFRHLAPSIAGARVNGKSQKQLNAWLTISRLLPRMTPKPSSPARWTLRPVADGKQGEPSLWLLQWSRSAARLLSQQSQSTLTFQQLLEKQDECLVRGAAGASAPGLWVTFERDCRWLVSYLLDLNQPGVTGKNSRETVRKAIARVATLIRLPMPARQGRPRKNR